MQVARIQRRTLSLLLVTQAVGGIGVAIGLAVSALLVANLAGGPSMSGLAQSAAVVGAALLAVPVTRLMTRAGRRPGLALAYGTGAVGAVLMVVAAVTRSLPLAFAGMFLFGGGTAANLQARYTAVDLADPVRRGRQLSFVVWATTIGSVAGPNLTSPADAAVAPFGLPELTGPFVISAFAFVAAGLTIWLLLRPDPLLVARSLADPPPVAGPPGPAESPPDGGPAGRPDADADRTGLRAAARSVAALPSARLGIAAVAVGHAVMVGVMAMTPVYIGAALHAGHAAHADVLRVVGIVLSLHIAGMYALSPVVGWATDRYGRRPVILTGIAVLVVACAVAGTAGSDTPRLAVGLALLGIGWSCTMVAGSTLLAESVSADRRPSVQGLSDLTMGLAGALAGALSGVVVGYAGYPLLALVAALTTVPLLGLALRTRPVPALAD